MGLVCFSEEQRKAVDEIYDRKNHFFKQFSDADAKEQDEAGALMQSLGIDIKSRELPEWRWRTVWSTQWELKYGGHRRRILFQW